MNDPTRGPSESSPLGPVQRPPWGAPGYHPSLGEGGGPPIDDPFLQRLAPPPARRSPWLAIVAVTSTVLFLAASAAAVWLWQSVRHLQAPATPATLSPLPPAPPAPSADDPPDPPPTSAPSAPAAPDPAPSASADAAARKIKVRKIGTITVVDLPSATEATLADVLAEQRGIGQKANQTLLVMTTRFGIQGFRDVDAALSDPLLQKALANVRLVRIDVLPFIEDLEDLGMPTDRYPYFFLLGPDLTPRDGIDGGEWDDDVARNIAPVLGAFVRGSYKTRRQMWTPPRGKGVAL